MQSVDALVRVELHDRGAAGVGGQRFEGTEAATALRMDAKRLRLGDQETTVD